LYIGAETGRSSERKTTGKRILVVEDGRDIEDLIAYHLQRERFQPESALPGEGGIELGKKSIPDLIVLNLMLPGMIRARVGQAGQ